MIIHIGHLIGVKKKQMDTLHLINHIKMEPNLHSSNENADILEGKSNFTEQDTRLVILQSRIISLEKSPICRAAYAFGGSGETTTTAEQQQRNNETKRAI